MMKTSHSRLLASGGWLVALVLLVIMLSVIISNLIKSRQLSMRPKPPTELQHPMSTPVVKCADMCISGYIYIAFYLPEGAFPAAPIALVPVYDQLHDPAALAPRKCPKGK